MLGRKGHGALGLYLLVGAMACEESRPPEVSSSCPSWKDQVRLEVTTRCSGCHPSFNSYRTFTDDAVARAGAEDSAMLAVLKPDSEIAGHRVAASTGALLRAWVVECELRYSDTPLHPPGLLDPRSSDFHARVWRESGYSDTECRDCHGSLTSGRGDAPACTTCHAGGESACSTCHAQIENQGAHRVHLQGGALGLRYDCTLCHEVPSALRSPGHVLTPQGELDPAPAEVRLPAAAGPTARYDAQAGTCAEVSCHVARPGDTAAQRPEPVWSAPLSGQACDRCHGAPPAGHVADRCTDCHPSAVDQDGRSAARHLNAQVELGRTGAGTCNDCHGSGELGAPPPALDGSTDPRFSAVGAHLAHLEPSRRLGNPAACGDCHLVPSQISVPGHIDTPLPAEVFPETISPTSLAFTGGALPVYEPELDRCSNTYCHGGAEPRWTPSGVEQLTCGSCHGVPPSSEPHDPSMRIFDCTTCHAEAIDEFGGFRFQDTPSGRRTAHINGLVDL